MSHRCLGAAFTVIAFLSLAPVLAAAQSTNTTALPRTPWGQPDLQGVWDFRTITPLERPSDLAGKPVLTDEGRWCTVRPGKAGQRGVTMR